MAGDVRLHTRFQQDHPRAPGNRRLAAIRRPREHQVTLLPPQQRERQFPARLTCASSAGRAAACCRFHPPVAQRVSARSSAHATSGTATLGSAHGLSVRTSCLRESPPLGRDHRSLGPTSQNRSRDPYSAATARRRTAEHACRTRRWPGGRLDRVCAAGRARRDHCHSSRDQRAPRRIGRATFAVCRAASRRLVRPPRLSDLQGRGQAADAGVPMCNACGQPILLRRRYKRSFSGWRPYVHVVPCDCPALRKTAGRSGAPIGGGRSTGGAWCGRR
jgi:hypothetical protein